MVRSCPNTDHDNKDVHVNVDVIVLGCSLPGIVAAHKLKKKFGDTMEIVVIDLVNTPKVCSKMNIAFQEDSEEDYVYKGTARDLIDNLAKFYLNIFAKEFRIILPEAITSPEQFETNLHKVFEHRNGNIVKCVENLHDFGYLNVLEKFELNQYQIVLEQYMKDLFQANKVCDVAETERLLYFDHTTMEEHLCNALLFPTSREIIRNTIRLVCGVTSNHVSVLFYLHKCYRTGSVKSHLDGKNTILREKLLEYCRKHLSSKLLKSIADITLSAIPIKEISSFTGEKVILKTRKGDTSYVCDLLAMAVNPDELCNIQFETELMDERETTVISSMKKGRSKKFLIQYEENFWRKYGYSGDIFSVRGPIIWATEKPKFTSTGSGERYATLIGYLKTNNEENEYNEENVINQLIRLFGKEAAEPVSYAESEIDDIYVPLCGNFMALRRLLGKSLRHKLEWGALDIFADGDVAAALEAGHNAYLHLLDFLRPQAQTYEDIRMGNLPTLFNDISPLRRWVAHFNISSSARIVVYTAAVYVGFRLARRYFNNN